MKGQVSVEVMISIVAVISFAAIFISGISVSIDQHMAYIEYVKCKNQVSRDILMLDTAAIVCSNCEMKLNIKLVNGTVACGKINATPITKIKSVWGKLNAE